MDDNDKISFLKANKVQLTSCVCSRYLSVPLQDRHCDFQWSKRSHALERAEQAKIEWAAKLDHVPRRCYRCVQVLSKLFDEVR